MRYKCASSENPASWIIALTAQSLPKALLKAHAAAYEAFPKLPVKCLDLFLSGFHLGFFSSPTLLDTYALAQQRHHNRSVYIAVVVVVSYN